MPRIKLTVAVFSKGKPEMTYTGLWFKKWGFAEAVYVVSPGDDVEQYRRVTGCPVVVATSSVSLPTKRQWAVDNLTSAVRPWLLFFEDNIQRVTGVVPDLFGREEIWPTTRMAYHSLEWSPQQVVSLMLADTALAEQVGAYYGGFSCNDNHFFRSRKYREVAFVWSKMGYCRRGGPLWPAFAIEKDDYAFTAECLAYSGRTLVNNFVYPWAKRYEGRGGSLTIEQRAPSRRLVVAQLLEKYPGLFRIKDKAGSPPGTEIQLRFHSIKQVDQWRNQLSNSSTAH